VIQSPAKGCVLRGEGKVDKRADLAVSVAIMVIGLFYLYNTIQMPWTTSLNDVLGPRFWPQVLGILLTIAGAVITFNRLRTFARDPLLVEPEGEEDTPGFPVSLPRVAIVCGWFLLYILSLAPVGYVIATPIFLVGCLFIMGVRNWRPIVGISLVTTFLIFFLFTLVMRVQFPMGPFEQQWLDISSNLDRLMREFRP